MKNKHLERQVSDAESTLSDLVREIEDLENEILIQSVAYSNLEGKYENLLEKCDDLQDIIKDLRSVTNGTM